MALAPSSDGGRPRPSLDGRVAVVMGAGSIATGLGNGKACAIAYARRGATVLCVDRELSRAEETAAAIDGEGGKATALAADATREEDVAQTIKRVLDDFGRVDILHNNVGGAGPYGEIAATSADGWDHIMALNAKSAFLSTKYVVGPMARQGGGVITNTSSTFAIRSFRKSPNAAYSAAKAAVESFTSLCAAHYGPQNIRVNAIRIGFSETPTVMAGLERRIAEEVDREAALQKTRRLVPMSRHGEAWDVAAVALFLASDDANYVSGVIIDVDGALKHAPF